MLPRQSPLFPELEQSVVLNTVPDCEENYACEISNVFEDPGNERVRASQLAQAYCEEHGYMEEEEALGVIESWKHHAMAQYQDRQIRSENSQRVVLSLFDRTGHWAQPWADAGYQVHCFDIQSDREMGDVMKFGVEFFADYFGMFDGCDIHTILAACPCTDFAVSGARHFAAKDHDGRTRQSIELVNKTAQTIEFFKPNVWAIENPVSRIERLTGLPRWRLIFDPNHYGHPYTKKTVLWGRFNANLPVAPVFPREGSKMHARYGGSSVETKNARSETPEGFAYSFFMANNAHDNPALALVNKFDQLDSGLLVRSIELGIKQDELEYEIEDAYYDCDFDAANDILKSLVLPRELDGDRARLARHASEARLLPRRPQVAQPVRNQRRAVSADTQDLSLF